MGVRRSRGLRGFWGSRILATIVVLITALVGCGSSSAVPATATPQSEAGRTCTLVAAVLSAGPDPSADPVGYAEAQVDPLEAISTSDTALKAAIRRLARAYEAFYAANGAGAGVGNEVTSAVDAVNKICPGAAG